MDATDETGGDSKGAPAEARQPFSSGDSMDAGEETPDDSTKGEEQTMGGTERSTAGARLTLFETPLLKTPDV